MLQRPPLPPFSLATAILKVRLAEDAWNTRDPDHVAAAYTQDSHWRNRNEFFSGREAIVEFLHAKWRRELDYKLVKELWGFRENRIAVRFVYESRSVAGEWSRSFGNEVWEFDADGLVSRREASINDLAITEQTRRLQWVGDRRTDEHPGLSVLGL